MLRTLTKSLARFLSINISISLLLCSLNTQAQQMSFLEPDKAFIISGMLTQDSLKIKYEAAAGYYMYQESMSVKVKGQKDHLKIDSKDIPVAHEKFDQNFNKIVRTYTGVSEWIFPITSVPIQTPLVLEITVQGCAEKGICYPPMTRILTLNEYEKVEISRDVEEVVNIESSPINLQTFWESRDDLNTLSRLLKNTSLPILLIGFFILGLGLAFTPCVLPMLPILSSIIFGTTKHHLLSRKRTITLAIAYVLGMASAFSVAGMATAWFGASIQAALQQPLVVISFGLLLVFLSGSLLGFYELHLPSSWHNQVQHWMGKSQGGSVGGALVLGALSSLVASPCVTAPLAGVLTFIAQSGEVKLGGVILFVMACGMGVPLLIFALGASRIIPRAGPWMIRIQRFFGIIMISFALWIVWPAITFLIHPNISNSQTTKEIGKLTYKIVRTTTELNNTLLESQQNNRPVLVTFYATWCVSCAELESMVLSNQQVVEELSSYDLIEVDVTQITTDQKELLNSYHLFGPPAFIFYDKAGKELESERVVGVISATKFLAKLK